MADFDRKDTRPPIFSETDIKAIARILNNAEISSLQDHWRIKVDNPEERRHLSIDIYPRASLSEKKEGALVAVYAANSHIQLHECRGYMISDELGEVTFISDAEGKLSGLVIEREAACSLYANADKDLLSDDFTKLGVEVMLSGVALSLAEEILDKQE
ncbi:MAG: hypothetical protein GY839_07015 [candidate division Zixibacteria bacterium]|nr:hypothetical protein [candidate division Zixibacteria bacterium]